MKTYLLEAYNSSIEFDKNSVVVALTPEVCYQLDKVGIKYSIIEDYYDEAKLFPNRYDFLKSQYRWFKKFDKFLKDNVDVLKMYDLNLASIYIYHIKEMVVDPLILKSFTLLALFDKLKPSSVTSVAPMPEEKEFNGYLGFTDKSLYAHLIPILCNKYSIPFTELFEKKVKKNAKNYFKKFLFECKMVLGEASDGFRVLHGFFSKRNKKDKLNILQLNLAYNGLHAVIDALKQGHNPYILINNRILKFYYLGIKKFDIKIDMNLDDNAVYDWNKVAQSLENHELVQWITEKCSIDVSEVVLPNLKYFVSNVCPELLAYFKIFTKFHEEEKIDFVLSPYMQSTIELAALSAANHYKGIKTVCFEHGDAIFRDLFWCFEEITNFDICVATNEEHKQYLENLCKRYALPTKIYSCSNRLLNVLKIGELRTTKKYKKKIGYNKIIYLPSFLTWDTEMIDAYVSLSPTRYYKFQKSLLEHFSKKREYMFVWKGLLGPDAVYNPIPDFIRDNHFSNIAIATNPFIAHLRSADRVICDLASTGFYESVVAGVPTMSLYHKAFKARKSAVEHFGDLLKLYSDIPEAINHIDEFLNSDPESYKTTIDMGDKSIIEILEENK